MNRDLLVITLFNFANIAIRTIFFAFSCFIAWRAFDMLDKVDIRKEITENKNLGWAIMIAAIFIGLAYIVGNM